MGHVLLQESSTTEPSTMVLLSTRIQKVLELLDNTVYEDEVFPKYIYNNLHRIYTTIHYSAPEIISMRNEEFGIECYKHIDVLKKFNVDIQIQKIMNGKDM